MAFLDANLMSKTITGTYIIITSMVQIITREYIGGKDLGFQNIHINVQIGVGLIYTSSLCRSSRNHLKLIHACGNRRGRH